MTLAEQFGGRLFVARRRAGYSLHGLSEKTGLSVDCIHKLERGNRAPRLTTVVRLANALGVDPAVLVKGLRP